MFVYLQERVLRTRNQYSKRVAIKLLYCSVQYTYTSCLIGNYLDLTLVLCAPGDKLTSAVQCD